VSQKTGWSLCVTVCHYCVQIENSANAATFLNKQTIW